MLQRVLQEFGQHQRERHRHVRRQRAEGARQLRGHPDLGPGHLGRHHDDPVRDLVEGDDLVGRVRQRLVHDRDRADPADGVLERRPRLRAAQPARLQPQQGRHRLQVVLDAMMDLADRRVLGHQLAFPAAQLGDVTHQDQRTGPAAAHDERDRAQLHDRPVALDLRVPRDPAVRHQHQRLIQRAAARGAQLRGQRPELRAHQVGGQAEAAEGGQRVGAGVGDAPGARRGGAARHRRGASGPAWPARRRRGTSPRPPSGPGHRRPGGRSAPDGSACAAEFRLVFRSITAITSPARVTGMVSARTGTPVVQSGSLSRQIRRSARAVSSSGRVPRLGLRPDHVVLERGGPGRRAHLGQRHPAAAVAQRRPEDEVGERQVGQELPVRHQRVQALQVGTGQVGMAAGQIGQRGHISIIAPAGRWFPPCQRSPPRPHLTRAGRSGNLSGPMHPHPSPATQPLTGPPSTGHDPPGGPPRGRGGPAGGGAGTAAARPRARPRRDRRPGLERLPGAVRRRAAGRGGGRRRPHLGHRLHRIAAGHWDHRTA